MKKILFFMFLFSLNMQASNFVELDFTLEEIKFLIYVTKNSENEYDYHTRKLEIEIALLRSKDNDEARKLIEELEDFLRILGDHEEAQNKYLSEVEKLEEMVNISCSNGNCIKFKDPWYYDYSDIEPMIADMIKANQATSNLVKFKGSENLYRLFYLEGRDTYENATNLVTVRDIIYDFSYWPMLERKTNIFAHFLKAPPIPGHYTCGTGFQYSILLVIPTEALEQIDDTHDLQQFFMGIVELSELHI